MSLKNLAMSAVTLGGQSQLDAAKFKYDAAYEQYARDHAHLKAVAGTLGGQVAALGELVASSFEMAKKSRRLLKRAPLEQDHQLLIYPIGPRGHISEDLAQVDRVIAEFSASLSALGGAGAGVATAVGSWSLVALVGSASTGTAISALSGVAATNATLAWFGGGALAAGGAGLAGGALVLGGIALAPMVIFGAWRSHSKAHQLAGETQRLTQTHHQVCEATSRADADLEAARQSWALVAPKSEALKIAHDCVRSELFPVWGWSFCRRWFRALFGHPFYRTEEFLVLQGLKDALTNFASCFAAAQCHRGNTVPEPFVTASA